MGAAEGSLLVVTGPPGAGKSTVAQSVVDRLEPSALVAGDEFFAFVRRGYITPWTAEAHDQNTTIVEAAARAAGRFVDGGFATVYDGVVGPWFLPTFLEATGLRTIDYVVLLPGLETCMERVEGRVGHGFRDLPACRQLHAEFATAEIDDRHVLADPPDDPGAVAEVLLRGRSQGTFTVEG